MSSILIKNATIATMSDKILQGDIYVEDNKIAEIARTIDKEADKTIDASGKVVMPGLVNSHTHVGMSLFRGYQDDYELMDWLNKSIWPIEEKMTEEDVYIASMLSMIEMIKSGTTTINDMYFHENGVAKAADEIGMRAVIARTLDDKEVDKKISEAEELHKNWNDKADGRIKVITALHAPYSCGPDTIKKGVELAKKLGTPLHMHYLETKDEIKQVREKYNSSVVDYLKDNNLFDVKTILAHGVWADEYDLMELQFHDASVIHLPISNCKLGSGIADMKFLIEGGINVALGSDGAGSTGTLSMFDEIKNSAYSEKVLYKMASAMSAKRVLEMATIKGAKAIGLQKDVGAIDIGKKADLIIIDLNKPHLTPLHNVYSTLAYSVRGTDVETVIIDGKVVMEDRKLLTVDEDEVMYKARMCTKKLFN